VTSGFMTLEFIGRKRLEREVRLDPGFRMCGE
jgi:hypothetical protein